MTIEEALMYAHKHGMRISLSTFDGEQYECKVQIFGNAYGNDHHFTPGKPLAYGEFGFVGLENVGTRIKEMTDRVMKAFYESQQTGV